MRKREIDLMLEKVSKGNNDAFEKLYVETRRGVYAFIFSYLHNAMDTEDVMQTVYLKIKNSISTYKVGSNGLAWILEISKNTALNELRRRNRCESVDIENVMLKSDERYSYSEDKESIMSAMKRTLSEEEQRIIILHVIWGYKHREIAEITESPTGTVTSKYKRAIAKLKSALKEEW